MQWNFCKAAAAVAGILFLANGTPATTAIAEEPTVYVPQTGYPPQAGGATESPSLLQNVFIRTDTLLFREMLDFQNRQSDKELWLLDHQRQVPTPGMFVGVQARLSALAAQTNTRDKFGYLGRFPTDFEGDTATDARLLHANAAVAGHVNDWITLYGELLFSDVFSFPDFKQGSLQVRQAYAVIGNLNETPLYGYVGKKNVNFGDMGTLSPFSQAMVWHYFGALHEGLGVGYDDGNFNVSVSALNGGRGIRASDSEAKGKLNNMAVNALLRSDDDWFRWQVGGGFLLGTIYDGAFPEHLDPNVFGDYNHAWDLNARVGLGDITLAAEYASTTDPWPSTGHKVSAYRLEAAYDLAILQRASRLSVSWSEGVQGPSGSQFEFNRQLVLGLGMDLGPHTLLSLEYIRSTGFAPLINITTVSDRNAAQDTALVGLTIVF